MSELSRSSPYRSTPDKPVTTVERERVNAQLNAALASGSLDEDSYGDRLDQLYQARTLGELVPVVQGLPPTTTHNTPAIVASTGGKPGVVPPPLAGTPIALVAGAIGVVVLVLVIILVIALL